MLLRGSHNLCRHLLDFTLQGFEDIIHDLLVVRQVGFEPLQCLSLAGVTAAIDKLFELLELLVSHLVGQLRTDTQFERVVDVLEHGFFLVFGQAAETKFLEEVVIEFQHSFQYTGESKEGKGQSRPRMQ